MKNLLRAGILILLISDYLTYCNVIAEVSVVTDRSESISRFKAGPKAGEGLAVIKDKYIWNSPVYGERTFVREMHQISTIGAQSEFSLQ